LAIAVVTRRLTIGLNNVLDALVLRTRRGEALELHRDTRASAWAGNRRTLVRAAAAFVVVHGSSQIRVHTLARAIDNEVRQSTTGYLVQFTLRKEGIIL